MRNPPAGERAWWSQQTGRSSCAITRAMAGQGHVLDRDELIDAGLLGRATTMADGASVKW